MGWSNRSLWGWGMHYALLHPWIAIPYYRRKLRWAWQRVFRGWDDRVIWSIDWYLAKNLPKWLEELKKHKHGVPAGCLPDIKRDPSDDKGRDEDLKVAKERWDKILDQMIKGFKSAYWIVDWGAGSAIEHREFDKAMELFHEWFFDLWD